MGYWHFWILKFNFGDLHAKIMSQIAKTIYSNLNFSSGNKSVGFKIFVQWLPLGVLKLTIFCENCLFCILDMFLSIVFFHPILLFNYPLISSCKHCLPYPNTILLYKVYPIVDVRLKIKIFHIYEQDHIWLATRVPWNMEPTDLFGSFRINNKLQNNGQNKM